MHDLESELRSCQIKGHKSLKHKIERVPGRGIYIYSESIHLQKIQEAYTLELYYTLLNVISWIRITIPSKATQTQAQTCSVSHGDARAKAPPITVINR